MPSSRRQETKAKPPARRAAPGRKSPPRKPSRPAVRVAPAKPAGRASAPKKVTPGKAAPPPPMPVVRRADGRTHVLSLSFVRDGDEFLARMETDTGQITELKNRALDQLLTLVASELEDLLE